MKNKFIILIMSIFILSLSACANYDITFNKVNDVDMKR